MAPPRHVPWERNVPVRRLAETGAERRNRVARQVVRAGRRQPFSRRERRLHPFRCRDPPPRGCRVRWPEARNRGYSYRSRGRVRALQAIPRPWIPPNGPQGAQNGRESGFPGFGGARGSDSCHQSAKEPPKGGSSSPRRSRPTLPASGPLRITSAGSSATTGLRSPVAPATGFGGWSTSTPSAPVAGRKRRGQRGRSPPPAPPGDTRSVATGGRLACLQKPRPDTPVEVRCQSAPTMSPLCGCPASAPAWPPRCRRPPRPWRCCWLQDRNPGPACSPVPCGAQHSRT